MSNSRLELLGKRAGTFFATGSPMLLEASALYLDKTNNSRILQMKWKNIDQRVIKAAIVEVSGVDAFGNKCEPIQFQYDGLRASYGSTFGEKTPIMLKDQKIEKYDVIVSDVSFADDSVWHNESLCVHSELPKGKEQVVQGELLEQYRRDLERKGIEEAASYLPQKAMGLWQCGCGSWQPEGDPCLKCGASLSVLSECLNEARLGEHLNRYKEEQERIRIEAERKAEIDRQEAEAAQREAEAKKKKSKRNVIIGVIAVAIVAVVALVVTQVIIPGQNYNAAIELRNSGNFDKAIEAFEELGDYRDSATQINETKYMKAKALCSSGNYSEAYTILKDLRGYKDVDSFIANDAYLSAIEEKYKAFRVVGSIVQFGRYEQDNNQENGPEKIDWIVLSVGNGKCLLLSKYGLDTVKRSENLWYQDKLRTWLNDTFLYSAFSETERKALVKAQDGYKKGEPIYDYVLLLSDDEVKQYIPNKEDRICEPTAYARAKQKGDGSSWWWLRDAGGVDDHAVVIDQKGSWNLNDYRWAQNTLDRPAIWVNLDSLILE